MGGGFRSVNVRLRETFGLYANVRPARTLTLGWTSDNIDLVVIRENLEGLYVAFEYFIQVGDDPQAVAIGKASTPKPNAIALINLLSSTPWPIARKKVTLVHKANVLKALTGIFLDWRHRGRKGVRRPICA